MTPKEKAEDLVNQFRMVLMNEDTECGNEILCTSISIENALICVEEIISNCNEFGKLEGTTYGLLDYWQEVKTEIEKL